MTRDKNSELIINEDGSIYHLQLRPEHIADDIITVGDPDRVEKVSKYFDDIEYVISKREFVTHVGSYQGKRIMVISTGIGTDNIDIVFNELEALANYNLTTQTKKETFRKLRFYRIGTSGALLSSIPVDSVILSSYGIGLDGLMHFYDYPYDLDEKELAMKVNKRLHESITQIKAYACQGSTALLDRFEAIGTQGYTITATGFYGPQGRNVVAKPTSTHFLDLIREIDYNGQRITNLEMETSGIYGLANLLGHEAISINAILANRETGEFSKQPGKTIDDLIKRCLDIIAKS